MPALAELEAAWVAAREDPAFLEELGTLLRDFAGRPTPLYHAKRLSDEVGHPVYLKREDLLHTGAHKINNALGQCLLAKRMGKTRIIAETGAGQHGVATATACALLGVECVVYMGTEDMRRQKPNVERMGLMGATRGAGRRRGAHAQGGGLGRDPRLGRQRRRHPLRDRLRGRPGAVPGARARPPARDRRRGPRAGARARSAGCPSRVVACVGGGSNAIGIFVPFVGDAEVALVGVEAAGDGIETGRHGAPLTLGGRGGVLHGAYSAIMQDEDGQILEAHSISAGLDYPGTGPEHAHLRDTGRARYVARHRRRGAGRVPARRGARGDRAGARVLARGRVGARARARRRSAATRDHVDLICLSRPRRQGPRRGAGRDRARLVSAAATDTGIERIAAAFAGAAGRAALMPYLMGGFPDVEASARIGEAYADAGADLVELGVPFSDPLADGPVIHAAGHRARSRAGATLHHVLEVGARLARAASPWCSCVTRTRSSRAAWSASPTSSPCAASAA